MKSTLTFTISMNGSVSHDLDDDLFTSVCTKVRNTFGGGQRIAEWMCFRRSMRTDIISVVRRAQAHASSLYAEQAMKEPKRKRQPVHRHGKAPSPNQRFAQWGRPK